MPEKKSLYEGMPTGEAALVIQRGIDATMKGVISDARVRNPYERGNVTDTPKKGGNGWQEERPLASPPGQATITRRTGLAREGGRTCPAL